MSRVSREAYDGCVRSSTRGRVALDLGYTHVTDKPDCDGCAVEEAVALAIGAGWAVALSRVLPVEAVLGPFPSGVEGAEKLVECKDADKRRWFAATIYGAATSTWADLGADLRAEMDLGKKSNLH